MALYIDSFQPLLNIISDEISVKYNTVLKGLAIIGLFYVTKKSVQLGCELISSFKTYAVSRVLKKSLKELGDWAVVVICDDLGSDFAYLLAEQEINLILIDYHPRIHELQITLENRFKIKCEKIIFSTSNVQLAAHNLKVCSLEKNYCALVNNTNLMNLDEKNMDIEAIHEMISVNVELFALVVGVILPKMLARNTGAIISVSSFLSQFPKLTSSHYVSTKVYMNSYMERLRHEHRRTNVSFTCLTPLNIKSDDRKQPLFWPSKCPEFNLTPDQYARKALPIVGWSGRPVGCLSHLFQSWFLQSLPRCSWVQNFFFYRYV